MEKNIDFENTLNSIENVKDLYQSKIPVSLLKKYIEETKNLKQDESSFDICWGNVDAKILIIGSSKDDCFYEDEKLWNDILSKGMKLKKEDVYCVKGEKFENIDFSKYRYILCLGSICANILKNFLKTNIEKSKLFYENGKIILETYSIGEVNGSLIVKKLFWEDLKNFIKELA